MSFDKLLYMNPLQSGGVWRWRSTLLGCFLLSRVVQLMMITQPFWRSQQQQQEGSTPSAAPQAAALPRSSLHFQHIPNNKLKQLKVCYSKNILSLRRTVNIWTADRAEAPCGRPVKLFTPAGNTKSERSHRGNHHPSFILTAPRRNRTEHKAPLQAV